MPTQQLVTKAMIVMMCVCSQIRDVDHLKERLIEEWRRFDQNIIDSLII